MVDKLPTSTGEFTGFQPSTVLSNWLIFQPAMFGFPVAYVNHHHGGVLSQETTSCLTTNSCNKLFGRKSATNYIPQLTQLRSGWWFQPLWKVLVKMGIFPKLGLNKKICESTTQYTSTYSTKMCLVELWGVAPSSASGFQKKKRDQFPALNSLPSFR